MEERTEPEQGSEEVVLPEALAEGTKGPEVRDRWRTAFFFCLLLVIVEAVAVLYAVTQWIQEKSDRERFQSAWQQTSDALATAAKVFLTRADTELGYASVDLEAASRHQLQFHLDEAERWLREALPLLSPTSQAQADRIIRELRDLPDLLTRDPNLARQTLTQIRDDLTVLATRLTTP